MAASSASRARARRRAPSVLRPADFRAYLLAKAAEIAPTDVSGLVAQARTLRARAARDRAERPMFARRVEVALALLQDHAKGAAPQIPYATVATLAAALFYYLDPIDVIPDFLPHVGTGDDALILEIAFGQTAAGVQRWLDWSGTPASDLVPGRRTPQRRAGRPGRR